MPYFDKFGNHLDGQWAIKNHRIDLKTVVHSNWLINLP
ncbi:hypothetical protein E9G_06504 [Moraxella catarrhalis 7169]|nr:hypothetical protein E9G_06504 [Moraxella catarrhalis 7169]